MDICGSGRTGYSRCQAMLTAVPSPAATRPSAVLRRPLAGVAVALLGVVVTVVSFVGPSWYTVGGPIVIDTPTHRSGSGVDDATVVFVSPDAGSRHARVIWALLIICVVA